MIQVLEFCRTISPDLENYEADGVSSHALWISTVTEMLFLYTGMAYFTR